MSDALLRRDPTSFESALKDALLMTETNRLASFFIEYYATYALTGDITTVSSIVDALTTLTSSSKKQKDIQYKAAMALGTLLMDAQKQSYPKRIEYYKLQCDVKDVDIELILNNYVPDPQPCPFATLNECNTITYDMYRILGALRNAIGDAKKTTMMQLGQYLLVRQTKPLKEEPTFFVELHSLKLSSAMKKDVVWLLWYVMHMHLQKMRHCDAKLHDFVTMHMKIFAHCYSKKVRMERSNIILYVYLIMSSKKSLKYVTQRNDADNKVVTSDKTTYLDYYTPMDDSIVKVVEMDRIKYRAKLLASSKNLIKKII